MDTERKICTIQSLREILNKISFINTVLDFKWEFHTKPFETRDQNSGWLVWVSFERPDTNTGKIGRGEGRKEIVWYGATVSNVVKTAWLLVELMVRHELMEGFRYEDKRIFNPHNTVQDLAKLQG